MNLFTIYLVNYHGFWNMQACIDENDALVFGVSGIEKGNHRGHVKGLSLSGGLAFHCFLALSFAQRLVFFFVVSSPFAVSLVGFAWNAGTSFAI